MVSPGQSLARMGGQKKLAGLFQGSHISHPASYYELTFSRIYSAEDIRVALTMNVLFKRPSTAVFFLIFIKGVQECHPEPGGCCLQALSVGEGPSANANSDEAPGNTWRHQLHISVWPIRLCGPHRGQLPQQPCAHSHVSPGHLGAQRGRSGRFSTWGPHQHLGLRAAAATACGRRPRAYCLITSCQL